MDFENFPFFSLVFLLLHSDQFCLIIFLLFIMLSELLKVTFKSHIMNIVLSQEKIDPWFHLTKRRFCCVFCMLHHKFLLLDVKNTVSQVDKRVSCLHAKRWGGKFERPWDLVVTFDGATVVINLMALGVATLLSVENHAFAFRRWQIVKWGGFEASALKNAGLLGKLLLHGWHRKLVNSALHLLHLLKLPVWARRFLWVGFGYRWLWADRQPIRIYRVIIVCQCDFFCISPRHSCAGGSGRGHGHGHLLTRCWKTESAIGLAALTRMQLDRVRMHREGACHKGELLLLLVIIILVELFHCDLTACETFYFCLLWLVLEHFLFWLINYNCFTKF